TVLAAFMWAWPVGIAGSIAQESGTPAAGGERVSLAFEFYPADTGWGTFFEPVVEAGTTADLTVTIANVGDVEQNLRTYITNAFTAPGGGFASAEYGAPLNEVSQWLDFPEETYTLDVAEGIERTFTVTVPPGTAPGQYITAIAGEHADPSAIEGQPNLSQRLRYVVPVFITVPGNMDTSFEVGTIRLDSDSGVLVVRIALENTGDVRVRPEGTVELRGENDALVASIPVVMESIYAREETELSLGLPPNVESGTYAVSVELTDPDSGVSADAEATDLVGLIAATPDPTATFQVLSAEATAAPDADNVQFVTIAAVILNRGDPVSNAQLSVVAYLNGQEIERFPVSQSLSLPAGETSISARYIPATGWQSGDWTFALLLETVEPGGASFVQASLPIPGTIEIE
ncbi:MAG: hypothetical protein AB7V46_13250, partial [Thermomicrobiales bacterium]